MQRKKDNIVSISTVPQSPSSRHWMVSLTFFSVRIATLTNLLPVILENTFRTMKAVVLVLSASHDFIFAVESSKSILAIAIHKVTRSIIGQIQQKIGSIGRLGFHTMVTGSVIRARQRAGFLNVGKGIFAMDASITGETAAWFLPEIIGPVSARTAIDTKQVVIAMGFRTILIVLYQEFTGGADKFVKFALLVKSRLGTITQGTIDFVVLSISASTKVSVTKNEEMRRPQMMV